MRMNPIHNTWRYLRYGLLLFCCSLVIGAASSSGRLLTDPIKKSGVEQLSVRSQSVAVRMGLKLEIVEVKQHSSDIIEVTIRNGYKKDITAIAASAGDNQSFHSDYIYAEAEPYQKLAPGTSDIFLYAPSRVSGIKPQIVVSAVIFSDRTSQGDPVEVRDILDKRLGMKIQLDRINPYLERLDRVKNSSVRSELAKLKRVAEALAIDNGDGSPMAQGVERGLRHGRAFVLSYLSKLETVIENQRIESFYQNGIQQTVTHSGEEDFRSILPRIQRDFKGLAQRL